MKNFYLVAVRKVIHIRYGIKGKPSGHMPAGEAERGIVALNEILLAKEV